MKNDEHRKRVFEFFDKKGIDPQCKDCGENRWIGGHVVKLPIVEEFDIDKEFELLPWQEANALMYYKVCANCGRVVFYSARILGIVGPDDLEL